MSAQQQMTQLCELHVSLEPIPYTRCSKDVSLTAAAVKSPAPAQDQPGSGSSAHIRSPSHHGWWFARWPSPPWHPPHCKQVVRALVLPTCTQCAYILLQST